MDTAAIASGVQSVAVCSSIFMFVSQWPLMRQMAIEGDASRYSFAASYGLLLTAALWLGYGIVLLPTPQVIFNNVFGGTQALLYLATFAWLSKPARRWRIIGLTVGYLALVGAFFAVLFGQPGQLDPAGPTYARRKDAVATIVVVVNTSLWASPLLALRDAVKVLSLKRVSPALSVMQHISSLLWLVAGCLLADAALIAASAVGVGLTAVQLAVLGYITLERRRRARLGIHLPPDTAVEGSSSGSSGSTGAARAGAATGKDKVASDAPTASAPAFALPSKAGRGLVQDLSRVSLATSASVDSVDALPLTQVAGTGGHSGAASTAAEACADEEWHGHEASDQDHTAVVVGLPLHQHQEVEEAAAAAVFGFAPAGPGGATMAVPDWAAVVAASTNSTSSSSKQPW